MEILYKNNKNNEVEDNNNIININTLSASL